MKFVCQATPAMVVVPSCPQTSRCLSLLAFLVLDWLASEEPAQLYVRFGAIPRRTLLPRQMFQL